MRRFKIDVNTMTGKTATIMGPDANHMANVLRLKAGDPVILFDGTGLEYAARIDQVSRGEVRLSIQEGRPCRVESPVRITVAKGFLKDKKMDTLIRQLTELGISRWIPFFGARSVPRPDAARLEKRMARWQKIATEALKQCRRAQPPQIETAAGFEQMLAAGTDADIKIAFWEEEKSARPAGDRAGGDPRDIFIILGPEGGLTAEEIAFARRAGFKSVSLGPRILRAETATLAACTLVQHLYGDMG